MKSLAARIILFVFSPSHQFRSSPLLRGPVGNSAKMAMITTLA
jgi:hypothetical protein